MRLVGEWDNGGAGVAPPIAIMTPWKEHGRLVGDRRLIGEHTLDRRTVLLASQYDAVEP